MSLSLVYFCCQQWDLYGDGWQGATVNITGPSFNYSGEVTSSDFAETLWFPGSYSGTSGQTANYVEDTFVNLLDGCYNVSVDSDQFAAEGIAWCC